MKAYIKRVFHKLINPTMVPGRFAFSFCVGFWIALSPFLGLQTWIALPLCWIFALYTPVVITVLYLVNNPLTMLPIIVLDYACGYWLIERLLGIDLVPYNPSFVSWVNAKIGPTIQSWLGVSSISFWCYIFGGIIFATLGTIPLYIPVKRLFVRFRDHEQYKDGSSSQETAQKLSK